MINSLEVEQSIIGLLLLFPELLPRVAGLDRNDFSFPAMQNLFERIKERYHSGEKFDCILLLSDCDADEKQDACRCMEIAGSVHHFEDYYTRLKELAQKRRIQQRILPLAYEECSLTDLQKIIDDEEAQNGYFDGLEKAKKNIDAFISGLNQKKPRIMTGLSVIDKVTGGIRKGCVFILGARPSTGKTALAINIGINQKRYNQKVLMFSLEMSAEMIFERMVSAEENIDYSRFSTQTLSDGEQERTAAYMQQVKESENFLVVDDAYTIESICNLISELKPDLAIVDFMQIVSTTQRFQDVRTKTDYISGEFKRIAKRTGCAVMVLSQLSRNGKDAPTMSDLKESGGLEADGDYIALLHRPYVLKKDDPAILPEDTQMLLDKNKFGKTGKIDLRFDLKHQKFYEVDQYHGPELPFEVRR